MKTIIAIILILNTAVAMAHEIQGTLVLKGALKTEIFVNGVKTTCKLKIDKVKNLLQEDSYGNPAYKILVDISLTGSDLARSISVKYDKEVMMTNFFEEGGKSIVKDLSYRSMSEGTRPEDFLLEIKEDGRLSKVEFNYGSQRIKCNF